MNRPPAPPANAAPSPAVGADDDLPNIPGYTLSQILARDQSTTIYMARRIADDQVVSLHVLATPPGARPEDGARLVAEGERLASIHHPNVVRALDVGRYGRLTYMATEFLGGARLRDLLVARQVSIGTAARLVEQIARGVDALHLAGVVHSDLNPDNIFFGWRAPDRTVTGPADDPDDDRGNTVPIISGLRLDRSLGEDVRLTRTGRPLEAQCYSPPEPGGEQSGDVYAIGAILYHLLTGQPPPPADRAMATTPLPPRSLRPEVPPELEAICLKCLAVVPTNRYLDAGQLAEALAGPPSRGVNRLRCPGCAHRLRSPTPIRVWKTVRCPECAHRFVVAASGESVLETIRPAPRMATQASTTRANTLVGSGPPRSGLTTVPGYTILGELGRGGFGIVYKARQDRLNRIVALKTLIPGPQAAARDLAEFEAEARAAARVHHPNIVQIFDVGVADGRPYLALEFVTGSTLQKRMNKQPQPVRAAAQLIATLARAVHVLHGCGIVHRDLKPANILLGPTPEDTRDLLPEQSALAQEFGVPKISDFGLAKRLWRDSSNRNEEGIVGTPAYMAPEQAQGQADEVGPAADVYALGAILYEMLTGHMPFEGDSPLELLLQVSIEDPTPPRQLRPDLPLSLEAICLKCLHKSPNGRYRSAQDLADDLRRYLNFEPVQARPISGIATAGLWALRNRALATLCVAVAVAVPVAAWLLSYRAEQIVIDTATVTLRHQARTLRQSFDEYAKEVARKIKTSPDDDDKYFEKLLKEDRNHLKSDLQLTDTQMKDWEKWEDTKRKAWKDDERHGRASFKTGYTSDEMAQPKTVPSPAKLTKIVCDRLQFHRHDSTDTTRPLEMLLFSPYPLSDSAHKLTELSPTRLTAWEHLALKKPLAGQLPENDEWSEVGHDPDSPLQERVLRYYKAWRLDESQCVSCHNDFVSSGNVLDLLKNGHRSRDDHFELGQVRGLLEIRYPLQRDLAKTRRDMMWTYGMVTLVVIAVFGLSTAILTIVRRRLAR